MPSVIQSMDNASGYKLRELRVKHLEFALPTASSRINRVRRPLSAGAGPDARVGQARESWRTSIAPNEFMKRKELAINGKKYGVGAKNYVIEKTDVTLAKSRPAGIIKKDVKNEGCSQ